MDELEIKTIDPLDPVGSLAAMTVGETRMKGETPTVAVVRGAIRGAHQWTEKRFKTYFDNGALFVTRTK